MAITTLDGLLFGQQSPVYWVKRASVAMEASGTTHSTAYEKGVPGAGTACTAGLTGEALTTWDGQLRYTNPSTGNCHLTRFHSTGDRAGKYFLCDRLWQNSGIDYTIATSQSLGTTVAIPARDADGATDGRNVMVALEFSTAATGGTSPVFTITYTNSAGTGSRTATAAVDKTVSAGTFLEFQLQGADNGVRSIQSIQLSTGQISGTVHLVLYRVLATCETLITGYSSSAGLTETGAAQCYDNTVPWILFRPYGSSSALVSEMGMVTYSHG